MTSVDISIEKILCIADIHGNFNIDKIKKIVENHKISEIFILGDFPMHGSIDKSGIISFFESLKNIDKKICAIPGNCDPENILEIFENYDANFHNKIYEKEKNIFIFFGGSNITPFNTTWEYDEDEIYKNLEKLFNECKDSKKNKILITHCPPYNTNCDVAGIRHVGSKAIREIIEKFQPDLNLCSHIHESYSKEDFIGKTKIVNVGEFKRSYIILKINEKFEIEKFLQ